jgi:hypothetical protein
MFFMMRIISRFSFAIFLFAGSLSAMEIKSLSHAVDIAGKQRMFTQRMLKNYAMIGMRNTFGDPDTELKATINDFESNLQALIQFNTDNEIKSSLEKVKTLWKPIKQVLTKAAQKEKAGKLQEDLEVLLEQANDATVLFAKQTGKASGEIINISGRQRMLSQRMASLYMLRVWGINDPKFQEKMDHAMALFKSSLGKLMHASINTDKITALLQKVQKSFMFFEFSKKFIPSLIYKKSNDILKNMNQITALYVERETGKQ